MRHGPLFNDIPCTITVLRRLAVIIAAFFSSQIHIKRKWAVVKWQPIFIKIYFAHVSYTLYISMQITVILPRIISL